MARVGHEGAPEPERLSRALADDSSRQRGGSPSLCRASTNATFTFPPTGQAACAASDMAR
jgi:hypothetical protein